MTPRCPDLEKAAAGLKQKVAANPDDPAAQTAKADLEALETAQRLGEELNKRREGLKAPTGKKETRRGTRKK